MTLMFSFAMSFYVTFALCDVDSAQERLNIWHINVYALVHRCGVPVNPMVANRCEL